MCFGDAAELKITLRACAERAGGLSGETAINGEMDGQRWAERGGAGEVSVRCSQLARERGFQKIPALPQK